MPRPSKHTTARGLESEARVLEACQLPTRPTWMHRSRRATRIEDRSGIDIVVESDVGRLLVQVKSSALGKEHFRPRAFLGIAVVVAARGETAEVLLAKVVRELEPLRAERQKVIEAVRARSGKKKSG
jgi:hypothetical protein